MKAAIGDWCPDVELPAHDGSVVRLRARTGRRAVLWFYPKADTPG